MTTPTRLQRKILTLLAANGQLVQRDRQAHIVELHLNHVVVQTVHRRTLTVLVANDWIRWSPSSPYHTWTITPRGRRVADVATFVRAFADAHSGMLT